MLDSADTKYDALITHIWALNNFAALFSNTVGLPAVGRACAGLPATHGNPPTSQRKYAFYGQVIHGRRYKYPTWRPSPMEPPRTSTCTLYF